jgi:uncharacterized protein (UPF0332 family)
MKEASWADCLYTNSSVKITPNREKAKSLIETAEGRLKVISKEINEKTVNYIFEDYYASVSEVLHALVILEGYRVDNHICLGYYLRDILKKENLYRLFDDCRFKRNSLVYYGRRMDFETAKDATKKAEKLFKELKMILEEKQK